MNRGHRVLALSVLALAAVSACRKKPETTPTPVTPTPEPTCDQRCRDSISMAEKRRADSVAAAAAAAEAAARERALASTRATLAAAVYFEYDSDELSGDARSTLDAKLRSCARTRDCGCVSPAIRTSVDRTVQPGVRPTPSGPVKRYLGSGSIVTGWTSSLRRRTPRGDGIE
jgi:hypothetical protein